jgi:DNA-binding transcriptional ArsR family regulator
VVRLDCSITVKASKERAGMATTKKKVERREKSRRNRLKAMEHPLRARMLRMLIERGEASPAELSRALGADLSDVSYHMRRLVVLECAELVQLRKVRGALEHFYRALEPHFLDGDDWEELDPLVAGDLVCDFMRKIFDDFAASRTAEIVGSDRNFHITRTPMFLDEEGFQKGMEAFERCRLEMTEIEAESTERMATSSSASRFPVSSGLALFKMPRSALKN